MRNYNKALLAFYIQLAFVALLGFYALFFTPWQVQSNLLSLLPQLGNTEVLHAQSALFDRSEQQVVIAVSAKSHAQISSSAQPNSESASIENAVLAYHEIVKALPANMKVLSNTLPSISEISQFYLPFRHNFLTQSYQQGLASDNALSQIVAKELTALGNPFVSETLAQSPRLNLAQYLNQEFSQYSNIEQRQGLPSIRQQAVDYYLLRLELADNGFAIKQSQQSAQQLHSIFRRVADKYKVDINYSGALFHTAFASDRAEFEISRFGLLSIVGLIVLILVLFKSIKPIIATLLTISIACFYGLCAVFLIFGSLHLLTLVFAVTLIGLAVDYCFHVLASSAENCSENTASHSRIKAIAKPLMIGFITTVLGYVALIFSPLELLSQVAVFMIFGLLGALLLVLLYLPNVNWVASIERSSHAEQLTLKLIALLNALVKKMRIILLLLLAFMTLGLSVVSLNFDSDVRLLSSSPQWLLQKEAKLAQVLGRTHNQRLLITADTLQAVLERQELVIAKLEAQQSGLQVRGSASLLPSIKKQSENYHAVQQADNSGHFSGALSMTGLLDPIDSFEPLEFADFARGPLQSVSDLYIAQYSVDEQIKYASWLDLPSEALSLENIEWVKQQSFVSIYDKGTSTSAALESYQDSIIILLVIAFSIVGLILLVRYGFLRGGAGLLAILMSAVAALLLGQLWVGYLNIFNLLAMLLVLALGVDYVVFYLEKGISPNVSLAIFLSAISSLLVFGILIFSATPAVQSFGATVMFGIFFVYILAPLVDSAMLNKKGT